MRQLCACLCMLVLFLAPAHAADSTGKVLRESWFEARTEQGKLGSLHVLAREVDRDGRKLIRTTLREEISYLRSGDPYSDSQEQETLETPSGAVIELGYSITLSKKQRLRLQGTVHGAELLFRVLDDKGTPTGYSQKIPWDPAALGLYAQDRFFEGKLIQPGAVHTMKAFSIFVNRVVPITYTLQQVETTRVGKDRLELLRIEQSYPREVYLTPSSLWLNSQGQIVKMQEDDTTLFGPLMRERTDKETAAARFKAKVRDKDAPVLANRPINIRRGKPSELLVRIGIKGDDEPGTLFAQDGRQVVVKTENKKVELRLLAKPEPAKPRVVPGSEYLESNFFIRSDDPRVKQLTEEAVGKETEPREQVRLIRKWMRSKFRGNYEVAFATADEVARTLEGDCSEMGMLAAAMCRSAGIPSRVAFGLVYDSDNQGFGGHLWAEVCLDGQWEPFDPTGVIDALNAAYLRVASYSMKDVLNPDELVEVRRAFAGQMKVEIVEAK